MRLKPGNQVKGLELPAIDGSMFNMEMVKGKPFMLSFYRFASCPFCNLRVNKLINNFDEFGKDFTLIAVFDSSLDALIRHSGNQKAPFHILADESRSYYEEYGIERSVLGMVIGMTLRFPTLLRAFFSGLIPKELNSSWLTMPADFLVDAEGVIQKAYYGQDEGDHLSFDEMKAFALEKRVTL